MRFHILTVLIFSTLVAGATGGCDSESSAKDDMSSDTMVGDMAVDSAPDGAPGDVLDMVLDQSDGDGVDADIPAGCGDGVVGSGESCDDGAANSNSTPGACRLDCSGRVMQLDGRAELIAASTVSASSIRLEFSATVYGTGAGLTLHGTRSAGLNNVTGFGSNVLTGDLMDGVVYGEIVTVSYDGAAGNLVGGNGEPVRWFKKELVQNTVPFAGREIFVRADATGSADGTSEADAYAVSQLNATTVQPGDRVNIKVGVYPGGLPVTGSGEPGNLIVYEGYRDTPGDLGAADSPQAWETLSGGKMPLFVGGNRATGIGIDLQSGKHHLSIQDLQLVEFRTGVRALYSRNAHDLYFDNIAMEKMGNDAENGQGFSIVHNVAADEVDAVHSIHVINSYVANCTSHNYWVDGNDSFLFNNRSYSNENASHEWDTDYMFTAYYGDDMVWRQLHAEKGPDPAHTGHGFTFKSVVGEGPEWRIENSLIDDCTIRNVNGAIEFRHSKVRNNLARNVRMDGTGGGTGSGGVVFRDGASFNTVDGCVVSDNASGYYGFITFLDTSEDGGYGQMMEGNVVKNSVFVNGPAVGQALRLGTSDTNSVVMQDNHILNNTFVGAQYLFRQMPAVTNTNLVMTNNILADVAARSYGDAPVDSVETYNAYFDYWGDNGTPPAGEGNLSVAPAFVDSDARDYRLDGSSPLRDAGTDLADVRYDHDGNVRMSGQYAIGAYEVD